MSVTPIRQGTHNCPLPGPYDFHHRDIIQCDTCKKYFKLDMKPGWEFAARWYRISRFQAWRARRRHTETAPEPRRCGVCSRPYGEDEEWCPNCTACPEHGNLCYPGGPYDCDIARQEQPDA